MRIQVATGLHREVHVETWESEVAVLIRLCFTQRE